MGSPGINLHCGPVRSMLRQYQDPARLSAALVEYALRQDEDQHVLICLILIEEIAASRALQSTRRSK